MAAKIPSFLQRSIRSFLARSILATSVIAAIPFEGSLPNGNFEAEPKKIALKMTALPGKNALPRWEIKGSVEYISGGQQPGGMNFSVAHGLHAVRVGNEASVTQAIPVKKGSLYALTFSASRTFAQYEVLRVTLFPLSGDLPLQTLYSSDGGNTFAWGFIASSNAATVTFHNSGMQEDHTCGPLIDAVAIKELVNPSPRFTIANFMKNGGFEEGPHRLFNSSHGVLLPPKQEDATSPLPGWIIESLKAVKFVDAKNFNVRSGCYAIELVAGRESAIGQVIRTVPNKLYNLSFIAENSCHGDMEAFAVKATLIKVNFKSVGKGHTKAASFTFKTSNIRTRLTDSLAHSTTPGSMTLELSVALSWIKSVSPLFSKMKIQFRANFGQRD